MKNSQRDYRLKLQTIRRQFTRVNRLIGLALLGFAQIAMSELVFQPLQKFSALAPNPAFPFCQLAEGADGVFYGTTTHIGNSDLGTVFQITRTGELTTLHSFDGTDGRRPYGGVVLGQDGHFYGTTSGGVGDNGKIFRIAPDGTFTAVTAFSGPDGSRPKGRLLQGSDGCLYGTTEGGGAHSLGTIFKVTTNGTLTTLFSFNGTNGCNPFGGLTQGDNEILYGMTTFGGSNFSGDFSGNGTAFKITTNGVLTTLVYFNVTNGRQPMNGLSRGHDGHYYGTTPTGGLVNKGTVFKMSATGTLNLLASFDGTNGLAPFSGVTQGTDGKLYGVSPYGTANTNASSGAVGTIYSVTTNGMLDVIARFNGTNAQNPVVEFTLARDGNLYGVTGDINLNPSLDGNVGFFFRLAQAPQITSLTRTDSVAQLSWTAFTNGVYRVEFKPSINSSDWTTLFPEVTAPGNEASFTDFNGTGTQGFYRVRLLP